MNAVFKLVLRDKIIKSGMISSTFIVLVELISIAVFYFSLPPLLPIFNQLPWGPQRLGGTITLFIPAIMAVVFIITNFIMITKLYEKTPLLSRILSITTLLITILSLIFILRTLQLVI